jgi:hypothetical protein
MCFSVDLGSDGFSRRYVTVFIFFPHLLMKIFHINFGEDVYDIFPTKSYLTFLITYHSYT